MAMCIDIDANGFLIQSIQTIDTCTTYALLTAQEYKVTPTLQDIFNIPVASDMLQMWELGFGLPILCYLVAWGYGTVINFFNDK